MKEHIKLYKYRYLWGIVIAVLTTILSYFGIDEAERDHLMQSVMELINEVIQAMETTNETS